jgi:hypothetical protein
MHELTEHAGSEFFLSVISTEEFLPTFPARKTTRPLTKKRSSVMTEITQCHSNGVPIHVSLAGCYSKNKIGAKGR